MVTASEGLCAFDLRLPLQPWSRVLLDCCASGATWRGATLPLFRWSSTTPTPRQRMRRKSTLVLATYAMRKYSGTASQLHAASAIRASTTFGGETEKKHKTIFEQPADAPGRQACSSRMLKGDSRPTNHQSWFPSFSFGHEATNAALNPMSDRHLELVKPPKAHALRVVGLLGSGQFASVWRVDDGTPVGLLGSSSSSVEHH